jgi:hypothetical protein
MKSTSLSDKLFKTAMAFLGIGFCLTIYGTYAGKYKPMYTGWGAFGVSILLSAGSMATAAEEHKDVKNWLDVNEDKDN